MTVKILIGDVRTRLRELPDDSVHCVVTSPPYWGLRQYLPEGAVVLRRNLRKEEKAEILAELAKRGVRPWC